MGERYGKESLGLPLGQGALPARHHESREQRGEISDGREETKVKRRKNVAAKVLSLLLSLVMVISLLPVTAAATAESDEASKEVRQGGMVLTKSVALQADGTYTIDLSAYADTDSLFAQYREIVTHEIERMKNQ